MSDCGWVERLNANKKVGNSNSSALSEDFSMEAVGVVIAQESDLSARSIRLQSEYGLTADQAEHEIAAYYEMQELVA